MPASSSLRAMRSAPCLVRENTSTRLECVRPATGAAQCRHLGRHRDRHALRDQLDGRRRAPISTSHRRFQELMRQAPRSPATSSPRRAASAGPSGRRRRCGGSAGRNPMSSMRSASSSTIDLQVGEVDVPLFHQVDQAAGRGHHDVDAAAQRLDLRAFADAAENGRIAQRQVASVGADVLFDLHDQLARRRHDQRAHAARRRRGAAAARASAARTPPSCRCRFAPCQSGRGLRESRGSPSPGSAWARRNLVL